MKFLLGRRPTLTTATKNISEAVTITKRSKVKQQNEQSRDDIEALSPSAEKQELLWREVNGDMDSIDSNHPKEQRRDDIEALSPSAAVSDSRDQFRAPPPYEEVSEKDDFSAPPPTYAEATDSKNNVEALSPSEQQGQSFWREVNGGSTDSWTNRNQQKRKTRKDGGMSTPHEKTGKSFLDRVSKDKDGKGGMDRDI